jgi:hypothetical protein
LLLFVTVISLLPGEVQRSARSTPPIQAWYLTHEICGGLMLVISALHLILHWDWIKAVLLSRKARLADGVCRNRATDLWLFVTAAPCTLAGVMFWPLPGIWPATLGLLQHKWRELHNWSGTLMVMILGIHLALHWKWIVSAVRGLLPAILQGAGKLQRET